MKKSFFPLLGIILAFAFTGRKDLPQAIAAGFNAKYPNAKIKSWGMDHEEYKVKFTTEKNKEVGYFSADGRWLRTEKHLALTKDLPPAVREGFENSPYAAWYIDRINQLEQPDQPVSYVIHVDNGDLLDAWHYDAFKYECLLYFDHEGGLEKTVGNR